MRDIKNFINEGSANLCTFNLDKFDHEEVRSAFLRLGESLHAFGKCHEFLIEQYKTDDGKSAFDIRVKDKSGNEYFTKTIKSK